MNEGLGSAGSNALPLFTARLVERLSLSLRRSAAAAAAASPYSRLVSSLLRRHRCSLSERQGRALRPLPPSSLFAASLRRSSERRTLFHPPRKAPLLPQCARVDGGVRPPQGGLSPLPDSDSLACFDGSDQHPRGGDHRHLRSGRSSLLLAPLRRFRK
jgi:hypothetical protein